MDSDEQRSKESPAETLGVGEGLLPGNIAAESEQDTDCSTGLAAAQMAGDGSAGVAGEQSMEVADAAVVVVAGEPGPVDEKADRPEEGDGRDDEYLELKKWNMEETRLERWKGIISIKE
jgi:hypothetical protein